MVRRAELPDDNISIYVSKQLCLFCKMGKLKGYAVVIDANNTKYVGMVRRRRKCNL